MTRINHRARRRTGLLASAALLGATLTFSTTAQASSPGEGSVSASATSVSWGGGPFAAPNTTGTVLDAPDCTAPQSCDDFTLHVSTPAGYGARHALKIDVSWPDTAADFDVYVLDRAGNTVGTS